MAEHSTEQRADALIAKMKAARGDIYREFVAIALLAFRGADRAGLVAHMQRAIRLGATREEIFEVLETCLVPGGAPTFHRGLSALMEVAADGAK